MGFRSSRRAGSILAPLTVLGIVSLACTRTDLHVGDDTAMPDAAPSSPDAADAGGGIDSGITDDAAKPDAKASCAMPAMCLPIGTPCTQVASGSDCPGFDSFCCAVTCPVLSPPAPSFCDGGPTAPLYDSKCITGYGCAPVSCASAGGQCVALVPGACAGGTPGDANLYSCGGGLGTMCCLP